MPGLKTAGPIQIHLALLLSLFILFSCAKGKEESEEEDTSTPYVASISPDNAATGFSTTGTITITFSKPIDKQTFTTDSDGQCSMNVQVSTDSFNTCLKLESTPDVPSIVWTLKPDTYNNKFPSGTTISIKIKKEIKDGYGTAMGADKSSTFTTETHCSTSSDCSWSQVTTDVGDLTGRSGHSGLVFNKKMWLFGGYDNNTDYYQDVMSSTKGDWENLTTTGSLWTKRNEHISLSFKNKMWVIGGKNASTSLADIWSSSDGLTWDNVTLEGDPPSARSGHAGVIFQGEMWVFGGQSGSGWVNDVYSSSDGAEWAKETDAGWSKRSGHAAVVYDSKIWVMGGNDNTSDLQDVWTYDGSSWTERTSTSVTWSGMKDHEAQVFDGKIWILGGNDNGSRIQKYYTFDKSSWSSQAFPDWSQRSSMVSYEFDNYLWVVGGDNGTSGSTHMKDVWKYGK